MKKEIEYTFMSPKVLEALALELWGSKWREEFCAFFDITYSQLHRYMTIYNGQIIPKRIAVAMDMLGILKANEIPFPTGEEHKVPITEASAVKFVSTAKPKVPRTVNDAPEVDFFGAADDDEEQPDEMEQQPPLETEPEQPEQDKSETETGQEKKRTRTKQEPKKAAKQPKAAAAKPARKRPAKKAA